MSAKAEAPATESIALRSFALLEIVVNAQSPLSLDDITVALGLPKPSVFRILNLLKGADLLRREPTSKRYTVGPRLTAFAVDLWRSNMLRLQWHRALEDAVAQIGESCNLTLLENNQVLYLDRVETNHPLRLHLETGTRVPLHCTASGKLFLSAMSSADARRLLGGEPYARFTAKTIVKFAALETDLAKVRRTSIGTHDCERFDDSVAIAVPVPGPDGAIFAAVAMHAPSSRASIKTCMKFVPVLQQTAATIAATLPKQIAPAAAPSAKRRAALTDTPRPSARRSAAP